MPDDNRVYIPGGKGSHTAETPKDYSDKPKRMDFSIADQKGYEKALAAWEARQREKSENQTRKQAEALGKAME
jgi:hypothetical protein